MTPQQTLEKAIEKAIDNGYKAIKPDFKVHSTLDMVYHDELLKSKFVTDIIYNHEFAKAIWGEEHTQTGRVEVLDSIEFFEEISAWKHHLQNMVVAPDPIKYLASNLE